MKSPLNFNIQSLKRAFPLILLLMISLSTISYGQMDRGYGYDYEEDDSMTLESVGYLLIAGAAIAGIGFLVSLVKYTESIGKIIMGIGGFLGIGSLVIYLLERLFAVLSIVVSAGVKLVLFGIAAYLVFMILAGIYGWLTRK